MQRDAGYELFMREIDRLRAVLRSIEQFGHNHGYGCGYTCADMAEKGLKDGNVLHCSEGQPQEDERK